MKHNIFTLLLVTIFSFTISACEKESEAEKAGNAIGDAIEEAKDDMKEASE